MPPAKPKKAASKPRKKTGSPRVLILMAVFLAVVAVTGIVAIKLLQTPAGQATLLDRGFGDYYATVQENIGVSMRTALTSSGTDGAIKTRAKIVNMHGQRVRVIEWVIQCDASTDFVLVNVALSDAARRSGGRVRKTEERDRGRTLFVEAGTRNFDTHHITLRKITMHPIARRPDPPPPTSTDWIPRIAIVIDDYGYTDRGVAMEMLEVELPLTIAVLPGLKGSTAMLQRAQNTGHCTLLHLPMEAEDKDAFDVTPVATGMSSSEITALVERYIESLAGIDGVNNHQGSLATTDKRVMENVLSVIKAHDLFFLDSLTSPKSVAYNVARELGVPAARNRVFLDDDTESPDIVVERIRQLVELAQTHGSAIGIAHPHRWTLDALIESERYLKNSGVILVSVCTIIDLEQAQPR